MPPSSAVLHTRLLAGARLRHLQAFVSLAEMGSAGRAAQAIGMTQPGVTNLIADLERLLECTLFHRHARGMRVTATAQELLPFVRRALAELEHGTQRVALRRIHGQGIVRVGAIHGAISGLLVRALPAFGRHQPDILAELREVESADFNALITNREIDLMVCREPSVCPQDWEFSALMPDRLVVVCGPAHPMAGKRDLRFEALFDETWLMLPPSTAARRSFDKLMAQHGREPRFGKLATRNPAMVVAHLRSEPYLLLTPYSTMRQQIDQGLLALLDVVDAPAFEPIGLLYPKEDMGEAALALKTFLRRYVKQHP